MKGKLWFVLAAIAAVLALIIAIVAIVSTGTGPRSHIAATYTRAAHLDHPGDDDNAAYTSRKQPSAVADDLTRRWEPQARSVDTTGIYLRYPDDAVIIHPHPGGSLIHVMEVERAYRHYHGHVSSAWGWYGYSRGEGFRGGGPGSGK